MHRRFWSFALILVLAVSPASALPPEDLFIRDNSADTGAEPSSGIPYLSEDIWVRRAPDPGYQPYPFTTPTWSPLPHENPEYRDPKMSTPNWVYVRVTNRGTTVSTGSERLRMYWAKASTGLGWPGQWVDSVASNCGTPKAYGMEITKPRKNAANATPDELDRYRDAIVKIGTTPGMAWGTVSYWHKQQQVHANGPSNRHGSLAFLPWHREMINRYEILLQQADPTVKLLYWDWTKDPVTGGFNFFTSQFMGASGRGTGTTGAFIGAPFLPALGSSTSIKRRLGSSAPNVASDATILAPADYEPFAEDLEDGPHDTSHVYIGGFQTGFGPIGNMASVATATQDPFFFLLHANADRLWAEWQRGAVSRLDPNTAYYPHTSTDGNITGNMAPWSGAGTPIFPWTTGVGSEIVVKNPKDVSVVFPPIYDRAPLTIPALAPGESVVLQIPWYPPNPADYPCESEQSHFCLLARIETSSSAPYGMTVPETISIGDNTQKNNNIAWKNVTVVPFSGLRNVTTVLMRNVFDEPVATTLQFADATDSDSFFNHGKIVVDLKPELYARWVAGGAVGSGVEQIPTRRRAVRSDATPGITPAAGVRITAANAFLGNIRLEPNEVFPLDVHFELDRAYKPTEGVVPRWDVIQTGAPGNAQAFVGGQRFEMNFDQIVLVKAGAKWRYLDDGTDPGQSWTSIDFDDSRWNLGHAPLGFGDRPATTIDRRTTTFFRHTYELRDPYYLQSLLLRLRRDDGAIVYLNGAEIHRSNMPGGAVRPDTLALRDVQGAEEGAYLPIPLSRDLLHGGKNVLAVELHQQTPQSQDATFDLELTGNRASSRFEPVAVFQQPDEGAVIQLRTISEIVIDAIDTDGEVRSVSVYDGGILVGSATRPPYVFTWQPSPLGTHRLRAEIVDNDGQTTTIGRTVAVIRDTPPLVTLTAPLDGSNASAGATLTAEATASDPNGSVARVDFYIRSGDVFTAPFQLVGSATSPPYRATFTVPSASHLMITAVARDSAGLTTQSVPAHVVVHMQH